MACEYAAVGSEDSAGGAGVSGAAFAEGVRKRNNNNNKIYINE